MLEDDEVSPVVSSTLPSAGKTPSETQREAELTAAVDGGNRVLCIDRICPARRHMSFPPMCLIF